MRSHECRVPGGTEDRKGRPSCIAPAFFWPLRIHRSQRPASGTIETVCATLTATTLEITTMQPSSPKKICFITDFNLIHRIDASDLG